MSVVSRSAKHVLNMNSKKVEESACAAAILTMVLSHLFKWLSINLLSVVEGYFTVCVLCVSSSENVLDDVEIKTSKHQSTIATHISNAPQVCTILLVSFYVFIRSDNNCS